MKEVCDKIARINLRNARRRMYLKRVKFRGRLLQIRCRANKATILNKNIGVWIKSYIYSKNFNKAWILSNRLTLAGCRKQLEQR